MVSIALRQRVDPAPVPIQQHSNPERGADAPATFGLRRFESVLQFDWSTNTLHHVARRWELTNTRFIACAAPLVSLLNQGFDPGQQRFKPRLLFEFYQDRRGAHPDPHEHQRSLRTHRVYRGLPRAKLYIGLAGGSLDPARVKQWADGLRKSYPPNYPMPIDSLGTNDQATLELLTRASFDPAQTVLLAEPLKVTPSTNAQPGTVEYTSYSPKHIVLKTRATAPSVLLLNDRVRSRLGKCWWMVSPRRCCAAIISCGASSWNNPASTRWSLFSANL